jgi:hypothetical protein
MLMRISNIILVFPLIAAYVGIVAGCTPSLSTRPNSPYQGPLPDSFQILEQKNPLLTTELAKLPEFQDGISESEMVALENMGRLYLRDPDSFDAAFKQMYRIGKPAVRKYCPPLQALFWLVEDGNILAQNNVLGDYSLKTLLIPAWQVEYCKPGLTDDQVLKVIEGMDDPNIRNHYRQTIKNGINQAIMDKIFEDYQKNPKKFSQSTQKIILKALRIKKTLDPRWNDFNTVVERLNAPELIDYYQVRNFGFSRYGSPGAEGEPSSSPEFIFLRKSGNCDAYAAFTLHCLRRAGYKCWPEVMREKNHITALFETDGGIYILDNAWKLQNSTGLSGPYHDRQSALNAFN